MCGRRKPDQGDFHDHRSDRRDRTTRPQGDRGPQGQGLAGRDRTRPQPREGRGPRRHPARGGLRPPRDTGSGASGRRHAAPDLVQRGRQARGPARRDHRGGEGRRGGARGLHLDPERRSQPHFAGRGASRDRGRAGRKRPDRDPPAQRLVHRELRLQRADGGGAQRGAGQRGRGPDLGRIARRLRGGCCRGADRSGPCGPDL